MTAAEFADKLFQNSQVTPTAGERNAAIAAFGAGDVNGRAAALRSVAESNSVYSKQFNPAFVLIQYLGYLRRNPDERPEPGVDYAGYDFWLTKLNQFNGNFVQADMAKAFIISGEYLRRFSGR